MSFELTPRERRWLDVVLFLAAVSLAFVVLGYLANLLAAFGDLILVFFLAWLLAFILTPLVVRVATIPFLSRSGAVFIVYIVLFGALVFLAVGVAGALDELDLRLHRERPDAACRPAEHRRPVAGATAEPRPRRRPRGPGDDLPRRT